jgi:ribosomal protein S14
MNECPVCGSPHDTVDGVIIHMRNMKDAEHAHVVSLEEAFSAIRDSTGDSEVKSEGTSSNPENRGTKVTKSDMFDEPTEGAELSDYSGDDESDYLVLDCGHQRVHKSDIPPDRLNVKCEVCGLKQGIKR